MTFNEIERRGYLQGEKDGKAEGLREGNQEAINLVKKMANEGHITDNAAELLISKISNTSDNI